MAESLHGVESSLKKYRSNEKIDIFFVEGFFVDFLTLLKSYDCWEVFLISPFPRQYCWCRMVRGWHGATELGGVLCVSSAPEELGMSNVEQPRVT